MRTLILLFTLLLVIPSYAYEDNPYPFTSKLDNERFITLTQETRCIVCQNQSLADSNAPLAKDLRGKIYHLILEKKSDAEIKDYLVKRYGEFILLRPRWSNVTLLLWLFPLIGFSIMIVMIRKLLRGNSGSHTTAHNPPKV